jgi:hypothetical protein
VEDLVRFGWRILSGVDGLFLEELSLLKMEDNHQNKWKMPSKRKEKEMEDDLKK